MACLANYVTLGLIVWNTTVKLVNARMAQWIAKLAAGITVRSCLIAHLTEGILDLRVSAPTLPVKRFLPGSTDGHATAICWYAATSKRFRLLETRKHGPKTRKPKSDIVMDAGIWVADEAEPPAEIKNTAIRDALGAGWIWAWSQESWVWFHPRGGQQIVICTQRNEASPNQECAIRWNWSFWRAELVFVALICLR